MASSDTTIKNWFAEKDSINDSFEIVAKDGTTHIFEKEAVLENFLALSKSAKKSIVTQITKIEYKNSDPNHFIRYVLQGIVDRNS